MSGITGPGNGHRTVFSGFKLWASGTSRSSGSKARPFIVYWRGGAGSPRPRRPPLFCCAYLASHHLRFRRRLQPMGWLQYSRRLGLSRGNPHILYLKAMTAQIRTGWTGFPQRPEGVLLGHPENWQVVRRDAGFSLGRRQGTSGEATFEIGR